MKKQLLIFISVLMVFSFITDLSATTNSIELRAFKDGKFIKDFSEKDVDIYYKGNKKQITDIALISKNKVSKVFGKNIKKGEINRNFVLIFSLRKFSPKIFTAIDHFFQNVILPGDSLVILTPKKSYNLKSVVLKKMPKQKIANQLKQILKKDIKSDSYRYLSLIDSLIKIAKRISPGSNDQDTGSIAQALSKYREDIIALENIRKSNQNKIIDLLLTIGKRNGQNLVYFFYDREFIPKPTIKSISLLKTMFSGSGRQDIINNISSNFEFYKREPFLGQKDLKIIVQKSNFIINPVFFKDDLKSNNITGLSLVEHSEDVYEVFSYLSENSGGKFDVSANLLNAFKEAINYSEYFFKINFQIEADSESNRELIEIKPKDPKVKISYRLIK